MLPKAAKSELPAPLAVEEEVQRLVESPGLQHAESLCHLLRYLTTHALEKPNEHVKEYQIALEVFGRSESFDSRLDSSVRVQTSRLRNKLIEYYATIGANDPLWIEIPKGTYSAVFHARSTEMVSPPAPVWTPPPAVALPMRRGPEWGWKSLAVLVAALAVGLAGGWLLHRPSSANVAPGPDGSELRAFWNTVFKSPNPPLLVFSNAEFKGRPETGLRYFNGEVDSREHINDLYTGVGEVLAVAELSNLFRTLNRELVVKRSGLLSWDETRNRDLIFAGSPNENLSLRELPLSQEFVFRTMKADEPRPGDLAIVNAHPRAGEPAFFFASPALPITEDYALVTLQPGLHPGQNVLLLAGTTTFGTQGAAEFVSQNESLALVRKKLGTYAPFSAVLHVRLARGVPVGTELVAIHAVGR